MSVAIMARCEADDHCGAAIARIEHAVDDLVPVDLHWPLPRFAEMLAGVAVQIETGLAWIGKIDCDDVAAHEARHRIDVPWRVVFSVLPEVRKLLRTHVVRRLVLIWHGSNHLRKVTADECHLPDRWLESECSQGSGDPAVPVLGDARWCIELVSHKAPVVVHFFFVGSTCFFFAEFFFVQKKANMKRLQKQLDQLQEQQDSLSEEYAAQTQRLIELNERKEQAYTLLELPNGAAPAYVYASYRRLVELYPDRQQLYRDALQVLGGNLENEDQRMELLSRLNLNSQSTRDDVLESYRRFVRQAETSSSSSDYSKSRNHAIVRELLRPVKEALSMHFGIDADAEEDAASNEFKEGDVLYLKDDPTRRGTFKKYDGNKVIVDTIGGGKAISKQSRTNFGLLHKRGESSGAVKVVEEIVDDGLDQKKRSHVSTHEPITKKAKKEKPKLIQNVNDLHIVIAEHGQIETQEEVNCLKWINLGTTKPTSGDRIENKGLQRALDKTQPHTLFTLDVWQDFGIAHLNGSDYVKRKGREDEYYFKPDIKTYTNMRISIPTLQKYLPSDINEKHNKGTKKLYHQNMKCGSDGCWLPSDVRDRINELQISKRLLSIPPAFIPAVKLRVLQGHAALREAQEKGDASTSGSIPLKLPFVGSSHVQGIWDDQKQEYIYSFSVR